MYLPEKPKNYHVITEDRAEQIVERLKTEKKFLKKALTGLLINFAYDPDCVFKLGDAGMKEVAETLSETITEDEGKVYAQAIAKIMDYNSKDTGVGAFPEKRGLALIALKLCSDSNDHIASTMQMCLRNLAREYPFVSENIRDSKPVKNLPSKLDEKPEKGSKAKQREKRKQTMRILLAICRAGIVLPNRQRVIHSLTRIESEETGEIALYARELKAAIFDIVPLPGTDTSYDSDSGSDEDSSEADFERKFGKSSYDTAETQEDVHRKKQQQDKKDQDVYDKIYQTDAANDRLRNTTFLQPIIDTYNTAMFSSDVEDSEELMRRYPHIRNVKTIRREGRMPNSSLPAALFGNTAPAGASASSASSSSTRPPSVRATGGTTGAKTTSASSSSSKSHTKSSAASSTTDKKKKKKGDSDKKKTSNKKKASSSAAAATTSVSATGSRMPQLFGDSAQDGAAAGGHTHSKKKKGAHRHAHHSAAAAGDSDASPVCTEPSDDLMEVDLNRVYSKLDKDLASKVKKDATARAMTSLATLPPMKSTFCKRCVEMQTLLVHQEERMVLLETLLENTHDRPESEVKAELTKYTSKTTTLVASNKKDAARVKKLTEQLASLKEQILSTVATPKFTFQPTPPTETSAERYEFFVPRWILCGAPGSSEFYPTQQSGSTTVSFEPMKYSLIENGNALVFLSDVVSEGHWQLQLRMQSHSWSGDTRHVGISPSNYIPREGSKFAQDLSLAAFALKNGNTICNGESTQGNSGSGNGDLAIIDIDYTQPEPTCKLILNKQFQPVYFTNIPSSIRLFTYISEKGSSCEFVSFARVSPLVTAPAPAMSDIPVKYSL